MRPALFAQELLIRFLHRRISLIPVRLPLVAGSIVFELFELLQRLIPCLEIIHP